MFRHSCQRFIFHYRQKGLLYAIDRGAKYILFLIKKYILKNKTLENSVSAGRLKLVFDICGVKIFWNKIELTNNVGLNIAINTLGAWTDSSRGDWRILKKESSHMIISNRWHYLPVTLIWNLQIVDERKIVWTVEIETEEDIKIDKKRALVLLSAQYKTWLTHDRRAQFLSSGEGRGSS